MQIGDKKLVNEREVAHHIGMSCSWFRKQRRNKVNLPYYRLNHQIFYNLEEVDEWFNKRVICSVIEE